MSDTKCGMDTMGNFWTVCRAPSDGPCMCDVLIKSVQSETCQINKGHSDHISASGKAYYSEKPDKNSGEGGETTQTVYGGFADDVNMVAEPKTVTPPLATEVETEFVKELLTWMRRCVCEICMQHPPEFTSDFIRRVRESAPSSEYQREALRCPKCLSMCADE